MRVTFDAEPEADPLLLQPDLYGGPGQVVGEQGWLFDCGRAERKPAKEQPRADQPEMFQ